mmetsp:Transcript_42724/g.117941  ORF Transcript_42724/g.117941 Transcript_42724/m.117941 type:complete len:209 (+) Transcript_42724:1319-1945(+)
MATWTSAWDASRVSCDGMERRTPCTGSRSTPRKNEGWRRLFRGLRKHRNAHPMSCVRQCGRSTKRCRRSGPIVACTPTRSLGRVRGPAFTMRSTSTRAGVSPSANSQPPLYRSWADYGPFAETTESTRRGQSCLHYGGIWTLTALVRSLRKNLRRAYTSSSSRSGQRRTTLCFAMRLARSTRPLKNGIARLAIGIKYSTSWTQRIPDT